MIEYMANEIDDLKRQIREGAADSGVTGGLRIMDSKGNSKLVDDGAV